MIIENLEPKDKEFWRLARMLTIRFLNEMKIQKDLVNMHSINNTHLDKSGKLTYGY